MEKKSLNGTIGKLSISAKLNIAPLFLTVFLVIGALISIFNTYKQEIAIKKSFSLSYHTFQSIVAVQESVNTVQIVSSRFLAIRNKTNDNSLDPLVATSIKNEYEKVQKIVDGWDVKNAFVKQEKPLLEEIKGKLLEYKQANESLLSNAGESSAVVINIKNNEDAFLALKTSIAKLDAYEKKLCSKKFNFSPQKLLIYIFIYLVLLALAVVGANYLSLIVVSSIIRGINSLHSALNKIATTSDLCARANITSGDEIGEISQMFNCTMDSFQKAIEEILIVVSSTAMGDYSQRVSADLQGDLGYLKDCVNKSAESIDKTMQALLDVITAINNGDFSKECSSEVKGIFKNKVDSVMGSMKSTIGNINEVMTCVSSGDLSVRIEVQAKGDLDILKNNINQSLQSISDTLSVVMSSMDRVAESASQATVAVDQVSLGSQDQVKSISTISRNLNEASYAIGEVTQNTESASDYARGAVKMIQDGQEKMVNMMTLIKQVADHNNQINKITEVIGDISSQTNLLSLNAAIEAARAGEHGKGFAVVADEVRKLAEDSSNSVKEITTLIDETVKSVSKTVDSSQQVNSEMEKISSITSESEVMLSKIAQTMVAQDKTLKEINATISNLNNISENNASATEEISAVVIDLASLIESTKDQIAKFKI